MSAWGSVGGAVGAHWGRVGGGGEHGSKSVLVREKSLVAGDLEMFVNSVPRKVTLLYFTFSLAIHLSWAH